MLEELREKWKGLHVHNRRAIIVLIGLIVVLAIVVVATVSKSASIKEPKTEPVWESLRLPNSTIPYHYDISLTIDIEGRKFSGDMSVNVNVTEKTAILLIHTKNMTISSTSVNMIKESGKLGKSVKIKQNFLWSPNDYWVIMLAAYIEPGTYSMSFSWVGDLEKQLDGLYLSSYKEEEVDKLAVLSQMEPLGARKVIPCFDEPNFKATFSMKIKHSKDLLALWNMPETSSNIVDDEPEWKLTIYEKSVKMSSYLLAFVIADFSCNAPIEAGERKVVVRVCGQRKYIEAGLGDYARNITANITVYYEKFYGEPFPLPKLDSVACPDFSAGAMENWGLILYRETALLFDKIKDTYGNKARVNTVIAHELAHQWFGNLVTMKWWNDLWLNEGFASYVEWLGTDHSEPSWRMLEFRSYADRSRALTIDSYVSSRPVSIPVEKPMDIVSQFDSISYAKGDAILIQAHMFMGKVKFQKGISDYMNEFKFGNAEQNDLYVFLNKAYADPDISVVDVMNTWTLQMNFPVISVRKYSDGKYVLSQQRFLIADANLTPEKYPSPFGYQWFVPVNYCNKTSDPTLTWLKPNSRVTIDFNITDGDHLLLNKDSAGYYIVDYSADLFEALNKQLTANHTVFTVSERQGLLFDTFLLVAGGYRPLDTGLDLLSSFAFKETELVVLNEIIRQIFGITRHIRDNETLSTDWLAKWKPLAESLFDKYGKDYFKDSAIALPDPYQERLRTSLVISVGCSSNVQNCVDHAAKLFADYMVNSTANAIEAQYKAIVFNAAVSNKNLTAAKEAYDFLWKEYLHVDTTQAEKSKIYYAMGLIQDATVLEGFSKECLTNRNTIRSADALYIMGRSIAQTKLGAEVSLKFMIANWDTIINNFKESLFAFDSYISGVLSGFSTVEKLNEIIKAFDGKDLGTGRAAYETSVQKVRANIAWIDKHNKAVNYYIYNN